MKTRWERPVLDPENDSSIGTADELLCRICSTLDYWKVLTQNVASLTRVFAGFWTPSLDSRHDIRDAVVPAVVVQFPPQQAPSRDSRCAMCRLLAHCTPPDTTSSIRQLGVVDCGQTQTTKGQTRRIIGLQVDVTKASRILPLGEDAHLFAASAQNYARLCLPDRADRDLLKSWLRHCAQNHVRCKTLDGKLNDPSYSTGIQYLINVQDMCIEEVKARSLRYFALSYVWGNVQQLRLLLANVSSLTQKGSLQNQYWQQIPRTIQDAINFTRDLDETYLWVDSICIIQDHDQSRDLQIGIMNEIYKCASLTLVALEAKSASSELPGASQYRSPRKATVENIQGLRLSTVLPPLEQRLAELDNEGQFRWSRRAWTFQEELLSRRLLYFSASQMYFKCLESDYREDRIDSDYESDLVINPFDIHPGRYFYTPPERQIRLTCWKMFIEDFSARHSTMPVDRGLAYQGIAKEQEQTWSAPFVTGLSLMHLPSTMHWNHGSYEHGMSKINEKRIPEWPSWSWFGWTNEIMFPKYERYRSTIPSMTIQHQNASLRFHYDNWGFLIPPYLRDTFFARVWRQNYLEIEFARRNLWASFEDEQWRRAEEIWHRDYPSVDLTGARGCSLKFMAASTLVNLYLAKMTIPGQIPIVNTQAEACGVMYSTRHTSPHTPQILRCECILIGTSRRFFHVFNPGFPPPPLRRPVLNSTTLSSVLMPSLAKRSQSRQDFLSAPEMRQSTLFRRLLPSWVRWAPDTRTIWTLGDQWSIPVVICILWPLRAIAFVLFVIYGIVLSVLSALALLVMPLGIIVFSVILAFWRILWVCLLRWLWLTQDWDKVAHLMWVEDHGTHFERVAVGEMSWRAWKACKPSVKEIRLA